MFVHSLWQILHCATALRTEGIPENRRSGLALTADCTAALTTCARGRLTDAAFTTGSIRAGNSHRTIHFSAFITHRSITSRIISNVSRINRRVELICKKETRTYAYTHHYSLLQIILFPEVDISSLSK